jgi:maltose alpha-D-glucosyltransferase/alpha-amylase
MGEKGLSGGPEWYKDAILYEVHVRAFMDANGDGIGDFQGLLEKLDYIKDLGVTAIWILPFYPSPLRDGGYDIADYTSINPAYGTRRDFKKFLDAAHERDLRVITELVINHTSTEHPWFQRARRAPPGSKERDFYVWSDRPDRWPDARIIFKDFETSNWTWDPVAHAYYWHRFYSHQPDLNFDNPAVHDAVFAILDHWMKLGVDGVRLDAVPYLYERDGTNCENLDETHRFLKKLRAYVDSRYRERMLLAEANQWPEDAAAYFGDGDECHMNFHFPLMPRMFMALQLEDSFPIVDILRQTPAVHPSCQWATFLRNHDELTLEMVTDEDRDYMYRVYAEETNAKINLGIRRRLAPLLKDRRRIELLTALLFALPGTPVLYYGDEIGMGDNFYLGDRDGVRTPMQWSSDRNAGFSRANPQKLYLPVIIDPEYHYESVNVEAQEANPQSLLRWNKQLIAIRRQHPVFGRGLAEFLHCDNPKILAMLRQYRDDRVLVVANLSRFSQHLELDLSRFEGMVPREMFGKTAFPRISTRPYPLSLNPHGFIWFELVESNGGTAQAVASHDAPPIELGAPLGASLAAAGPDSPLVARLGAWAKARRWYRGKARAERKIELADAIPLGTGAEAPWVVLLRFSYVEGEEAAYLAPLALLGAAEASALELSPASIITKVATPGGAHDLLIDATALPGFGPRLIDLVRRRSSAAGKSGALTGLPGKALKAAAVDETSGRLLSAEQSNSCIVVGDKLMVKLLRAVDTAINPELEIGRYFAERTDFTHSPGVAGALEYHTRSGSRAVVALLQPYVENRGDAWQVALDALDLYYERVLSEHGDQRIAPEADHPLRLTGTELPEPLPRLIGTFPFRARLLGQRTAEMQLALYQPDETDPAFSAEPFSLMHQRSLYQSAHDALVRNFQQLRRGLPTLPAELHPRIEQLLARESFVDGRLKELVGRKIDVLRIRCHGDYHLGQVLSTGDDFIIIDFEGEPARPANERRYKRCVLRDVAGMLRSFHYASEQALRRGHVRPEDQPKLEPWARLWTAYVSAAFLEGYLHRLGQTPLLPTGPDLRLLLDFYTLEKCIYEIGYELGNRPDWLYIPLDGLHELTEPRRG